MMFFVKLLVQLSIPFVSGAFAGWSCTNNDRTTQSFAIESRNGTIRSPNYPRYYSDNLDCQWQITVPTGKWIKLTFLHMDLEYQSSCSNDYVELRSGFSQSSMLIGRYCGISIPSPKYSSSNKMLVKFKSDYYRRGTGFKAKWETVDYAGKNNDDSHHKGSSTRSSSGSIGGSVAGLIVLIVVVLFVYYYCKWRRSRPTVIVRETRAAAQPTIIVANTNVTQQQQVPVAVQHPQAMVNPACSPAATGPYPGYYAPQQPLQGVPYPQAQPIQQGYPQSPVPSYPQQATQPQNAPSFPPQATHPPPYSELPTKQ